MNVGLLIKLAYGDEGHRLLQTSQNQGIGATSGSAFDRLSHEGNLMTDGGRVENSALRRAAQSAEQQGGVFGKVKGTALRGAARVADMGDVLTSPFNVFNSRYHNMTTGGTPGQNPASQEIVRKGQTNAAQQLANAAERLDKPSLKGMVPFGGIRDKWNEFRAGQQLTDSAIQFGREGGHVFQDAVPHGQRVQQIAQGIREGSTGTGFDRAVMRATDIMPDNRVKTTIQSGLAHRNPQNLNLIDSAGMITPEEHHAVRGVGQDVRKNAIQHLVDRGHSLESAEQAIGRALSHTPSIPQELAGKAVSQGRVLARTMPVQAVSKAVSMPRQLFSRLFRR